MALVVRCYWQADGLVIHRSWVQVLVGHHCIVVHVVVVVVVVVVERTD